MSASVRLADAADYPAFVRLFPELAVADPVPTPEQFTSSMLPRVVLFEEDGQVCAYAFWLLYGATAHVVHLVVDPQARGRGVGRALLEDVRGRVVAQQCLRWCLNVKQDNAAAIALYRRCGFATEHPGWAMRTTWANLATLPDAPEAVVTRTLDAADDALAGGSLGIEAERLALIRGRPGVVLLAAWEGTVPAAVAAFDPAFPGVYPIRLARPELARSVLDALRPSARHDHVFITVERDAALFDRLRAGGAELLHAFYRMSAPLA